MSLATESGLLFFANQESQVSCDVRLQWMTSLSNTIKNVPLPMQLSNVLGPRRRGSSRARPRVLTPAEDNGSVVRWAEGGGAAQSRPAPRPCHSAERRRLVQGMPGGSSRAPCGRASAAASGGEGRFGRAGSRVAGGCTVVDIERRGMLSTRLRGLMT